MGFENRVYVILHPNQALIVSQLPPSEFALHYQARSRSQSPNKLLFFELDSTFDHPYFGLQDALNALARHSSSSPKRTKFVSCYRVLEHLSPSAVKELYISTEEGFIMPLHPAPVISAKSQTTEVERLRIFAEICPLSVLALTRLGPGQFGRLITTPPFVKGAPAIFFTQINMDISDFIARYNKNPFVPCPLPSVHPGRLAEAVSEFDTYPDKLVKGLCLSSSLDELSYKHIKHGFWFVAGSESVFFNMPSASEIESHNFKFWRSM